MKKNADTRVTVIMPVYNDEKTVKRAIESILNQTYDKWIMIICDDGSTDHTGKILADFKKEYPNKIILITNKENRGITYSLNKMLRLCKTEYVARMDADDISRKKRLEKQVQFLDKYQDVAVAGSAINKFDEHGIFKTVKYPPWPEASDLIRFAPFAHPAIMIRNDVIRSLKGYRDLKRTRRCEDYDLWFRLYEKGYTGGNIEHALLDYYEGRDSYQKRKAAFRVAELITRADGYRRNRLYPKALPYVLKPVLIGFIPVPLMFWYKSRIQELYR